MRPQGAAFDIGAFELAEAAPGVPCVVVAGRIFCADDGRDLPLLAGGIVLAPAFWRYSRMRRMHQEGRR